MSSLKSESVQDEYNALVNDVIDDLNDSSDFSGTEIEDKKQQILNIVSTFKKPWFFLISFLIILNIAFLLKNDDYFFNSNKKVLSEAEANKEITKVFGLNENKDQKEIFNFIKSLQTLESPKQDIAKILPPDYKINCEKEACSVY